MRCFMIRLLPAAVVVGMLQLGMVVPGAKRRWPAIRRRTESVNTWALPVFTG